jgi:hypothetical protein
MEQERQMSPNVGPTFSDMSPTCRPTRQCFVKIADADIQQTQLSNPTRYHTKKLTQKLTTHYGLVGSGIKKLCQHRELL